MIVPTALQLADSYMEKQSHTILQSMDELMKKTELTRMLIEKKRKLIPQMKSLPKTSVTLKLYNFPLSY